MQNTRQQYERISWKVTKTIQQECRIINKAMIPDHESATAYCQDSLFAVHTASSSLDIVWQLQTKTAV